jgi:galactokinase/mevalonate kinase-like predicted kinase
MTETLLTVPPALCEFLHNNSNAHPAWLKRLGDVDGRAPFVGADPRGLRLGSGGGTVNVLYQAWRESGARQPLEQWLEGSQKLILHSGGESRRLPAYAAIGKAFMPLPSIEGLRPRLADQLLADFQLPAYRQTLLEAGARAAALVTSGDVWLDFDTTDIPNTSGDIVGIGMQVSPEVAQHFGVFFVGKEARTGTGERNISFFRQKPAVADIVREAVSYDFYVDTGMWLLSAKALRLLFRRCGWDVGTQRFKTKTGLPSYLDLYTEVGSALGSAGPVPSSLAKVGFGELSSSVVPLHSARFYHLGSSRQLLESMEQLQWQTLTPQRSFRIGSSTPPPPEQTGRGLTWVESVEAPGLRLQGLNIVSGVPAGNRLSHLQEGQCVDATPLKNGKFALRVYHIDDTFRGTPDKGAICGQPASRWLGARGYRASTQDIFDLPLFPVLPAEEITDEIVQWFFSETPAVEITEKLQRAPRISSAELANQVDFTAYFAQRKSGYVANLKSAFEAAVATKDTRVFEQDFAALAKFALTEAPQLGSWLRKNATDIHGAADRPEHRARFSLLIAQLTKGEHAARWKLAGFETLQSALVQSNKVSKAIPRLAVKEDQIVWARSPVRLDLAGGWTDTPPYCLESGGAVLNVAVLLNGQPPIQVFLRPTAEPVIRLRSIDLGSAETVDSFETLADFKNPRGNFSLPKAALALAGFLPQFYDGRRFRSLRAQLKALGRGLEISLLSAVPKGSGLGTSSILGATLLGAINRACGLGWDDVDLYNRVLGVEQLLTTGGGWQDQAGAIFPSIKLVETQPGLSQVPTVRYLPAHAFDSTIVNRSLLLYYTGATRMAKGILQEIVEDMFLGSARTLRTLQAIRANAWKTYHALQLRDLPTIKRSIARSWRLNQLLDSGTTTPEIERIIRTCGPDLSACKLLGAGGGGYMLIAAHDAAAGERLRVRLEQNPPNPRARFIDFAVSDAGVQVTVS